MYISLLNLHFYGDFLENLEVEKCISGMNFVNDWATWRKTVKEQIAQAKKMGLSESHIEELAQAFTSFLAEKVCPATPEEELLKEMWDTSSSDERKVLTRILFKMMEK
jgi:sulfur relay (sulfurtransferase) DsrC/TusE family protein